MLLELNLIITFLKFFGNAEIAQLAEQRTRNA